MTAALPVAAAGPDQSVVRGSKVTLNGTASTGATTYQWTQVQATGDPAVTLTGATTATPSFTIPAYDKPLTFQLTVTGRADHRPTACPWHRSPTR